MADGCEYFTFLRLYIQSQFTPRTSPLSHITSSPKSPFQPLTPLAVNEERAIRVANLISDFRSLQHHIASISPTPPHPDDYYAEGYSALRQCTLDGQHILNVAADTRVPRARGGSEEQEKAELAQVLLDGYSRRHEAQKIWLRQSAVMRWIGWRASLLMGVRPDGRHAQGLAGCDQTLRAV